MTSQASVLVVGAGPVGLMMSSELARRGVSCRLIDQLPEAQPWSKALGIHSRTLEILSAIGIIDQFLAIGRKMHGTNVYSGSERLMHASLDELDAPFPFALSLPQCETERLLTEHASRLGVSIERSTKLQSLSQQDGEVRFELTRDGATERGRADYVIGCDGCHSTVRKSLGIAFEGDPLDEEFMLCDVTLDWDMLQDEVHTFFAPQGIFACLPLPPDHRWRVVVDAPGAIPQDEAHDVNKMLPRFQAWFEERAKKTARLRDPTWCSSFHIQSRIAQRYRDRRVFIAGDAAHIHSPLGGQGMNTGLQDAYNLAWKMALVLKGDSDESILESYAVERRPIARAVVLGTELTTKMVTLRHPVSQAIRNKLMRFVTSLEVVQERGARTASGIANNYRGSPIVGEHRMPVLKANVRADRSTELPSVSDWLEFGAAPRAGDRAPDVLLGDGESRFHTLLLGTEHVLVLFDGAAATPEGYEAFRAIAAEVERRYRGLVRTLVITPLAERPKQLDFANQVLLDKDGAVHRRYGATSECLYLIRPDGYVGFRAQPAARDPLFQHLKAIFPRRS
jgi:2-polyprenyl-6-methoxyphenol hydroxylase-like FAD-dependent oxidoreductase